MLNRRDLLLASVAAGVAMQNRTAFAKAAQPTTKVDFDVPAHACDCHTHIHLPEKYPFFAGRGYTPEAASPEEMAALHKFLGIENVVIVTPSVYGTDNRATLEGMKFRGNTARGIAVIDDKTTESELDEMGKAGIKGIRVNLANNGISDPNIGRKRLEAAIDRVKGRGWHVQCYTNLSMLTTIKDVLASAPVPLVFDHFGGADASLGLEQPGWAELVEGVKSGKVYVKISGAYRLSKQAPDYPDALPFAKALIAANADRLVWGSDWPHPDSDPRPDRKPTDLAPLQQIDDGRVLNLLATWAPDAATRKKILVDNPTRLYGF